ncbi:hypothetical protein DFH08DRAFT_943051 [Mycena albidolilacea]|uniref:Uncharacterized protein n=1 Tax=Mycena albidolilacea TaxID=1033008 RepID=A0AAD7EEX3_9AGAR|nr:hypothetical protein DFH08DRAFT_943047 [Mycena albidolilacea]KAJ7315006.1 hypothetical protein DFH08DRAFT_943051 [Mycena albidolilacea]
MSTPQTSTKPGPVSTLARAAHTLGSGILDTLRLAKEAATGSSVPGLEGTIRTVLALAEMVQGFNQSMKSNKKALAELQPYLEDLNKIDTSDCSNDLKDRLEAFQMKVTPIIAECKSLQLKGKVTHFWKGKEYKEKIQDLRDRVAGHIRDFTFYSSISVEILVGNLVAQVTQIAPQVQETNQNGMS